MMIYKLLDFIKTKEYFKETITILILINMMLALAALLRDIFLASYLGTSYQADALVLALFLPDTVGNNLLAASIGVACVPVFSKLFVSNKLERLFSCLKNIIISFLVISFIFLVLFYFYGYDLIQFFGSGFSPKTGLLSLKLFHIIIPTVVLFPLVTIGSSMMQVFNNFVVFV